MQIERHGTTRRYSDSVVHNGTVYLVEVPSNPEGDIAAVVDGKLHFAVDGRGEACVPSVVHFPKSGPPIVG